MTPMQKLIAASIILITLCVVLHGQERPVASTTGVIDGQIVNENGQPMPGASLFIRPVNSPGMARTATTDVDGNFRVTGLEPALYVVSGNAPAYTSVPGDPSGPTYYRS